MSAEDASSELRMLRAKAYGPDGGLSSIELMRLQELEGWGAVSEPASPIAEPVEALGIGVSDPSTGSGADGSDPSEGIPIAEPVEALGIGGSDPSTGSGAENRRRRPVILGAAAALLAIGLGVGWGIWGWDSHQFALAAAHGEERAELEASGSYDPGTVVPVAEQHGVVIWRADRSDGEELCVIVTGAEHSQDGCITYDEVERSNWPNASATIPEGQDEAGNQLLVGLVPTPSGELVPFIQVWGGQDQYDWQSQFTPSELAQVRELEAAGYAPDMLNIIGYDGETPVWSNWLGNLCIIVFSDAGRIEACAENSEETLTMTAPVEGIMTEYIVHQSEMRGPQLTIVRHPTTVSVDPETGDVIEFSVDEPMFDDLVIDDKTGDVEQ